MEHTARKLWLIENRLLKIKAIIINMTSFYDLNQTYNWVVTAINQIDCIISPFRKDLEKEKVSIESDIEGKDTMQKISYISLSLDKCKELLNKFRASPYPTELINTLPYPTELINTLDLLFNTLQYAFLWTKNYLDKRTTVVDIKVSGEESDQKKHAKGDRISELIEGISNSHKNTLMPKRTDNPETIVTYIEDMYETADKGQFFNEDLFVLLNKWINKELFIFNRENLYSYGFRKIKSDYELVKDINEDTLFIINLITGLAQLYHSKPGLRIDIDTVEYEAELINILAEQDFLQDFTWQTIMYNVRGFNAATLRNIIKYLGLDIDWKDLRNYLIIDLSEKELRSIKGIGKVSIESLKSYLKNKGLELAKETKSQDPGDNKNIDHA